MQYNQQAPWTPHHSASLSVVSPNRQAPRPRPRHTTLPGPPLLPQRPPPAFNDHSRHIPIPASLTPGRRPPAAGGGTRQSFSYNTSGTLFVSPQHTSFYGDYFFSRPHPTSPPPPVPQKPLGMTAPPLPLPRPPVPPRPPLMNPVPLPRHPLYPTSIPGPIAGPSSHPMQTSEEPLTDDKDIALALALSESEARQREENIIAQEEADLMKALEESRLSDSGYSRYNLFDERLDFQDGPSSSTQPSASVSSSPGKTFLNPGAISAHNMSRQPSEDESFLHMITPTTSEYCSDTDDSVHQQSIECQDSSQSAVDDSRSNRDYSTPTPPPYADVVSIVKLDDDTKSCGTPSSMCSTPVEFPRASDHVRPPQPPNSAPPYLMSSPQPITPELPPQPRRPSIVHSESSSSSGRSSMSENSLLSSISKSSQSALMSSRVSVGSSYQLDSVDEDMQEDEDDNEGTDPNARPVPPLTANQYVEPEMLMGISMGFSRPVISTVLSPMATAMPQVITLPYGKAPIFHFQAPTWRHMLKLMARLSGTRVEPTVEAITLAKHELKLRTVIQFVKVHHSASEWRTLLYFTTDMPPPTSVANSYKYTNNDVNTLPYSYTLSPLPQLLRDGADSPMAKYYVVPATNSTPYPTLPINFPNLAMYLQSAVEDSRKAANDSSGGVRKLAHNIDSCYPRDNERPDSLDLSETSKSRGVGGMFKRVINRGKTPRGRGGNEEIYDLVTPFVSEEWG